MNMKTATVGQFLLSLVHSYGVEDIYSVDGDAVIRIRNEIENFGKIRNVTCAHEATAAFSAEAYGRIKRLGVFYVTYNAGINNALNAIDEGYLHNSALVIIGGEPSMKFRAKNPCLHHHQLRCHEFDDQLKVMEVKLGEDRAVSITDMETAAERIAVMVGKAIRDRLPVYLGIPSDAWDKTIAYSEDEIKKIRDMYDNDLSDVENAFADTILSMLKDAIAHMKHPIISVGHEVLELGLLPETIRLAEKLQVPVVSRFNGFNAFPIDHPLFMGTYNGPASVPPNIREFTENAERIDIGVLETDLNFALQTDTVKLPRAAIVLDPRSGYLSSKQLFATCNARSQKWLLGQLADTVAPAPPQTFTPFKEWVETRDHRWTMSQTPEYTRGKIRVADIAPILNFFLKDKDTPIIADVGDAMFIAQSIPAKINYTSIFAAMGIFAGCIGLEHATGKRPLVLVGDGAFCMGEVYSLTLTEAKPIIIILNNGGWSMMRQLRTGSNVSGADSLVWPEMHFGADRDRWTIDTPEQFLHALEIAWLFNGPLIIEVRLDLDDKSEPLQNFKDVHR